MNKHGEHIAKRMVLLVAAIFVSTVAFGQMPQQPSQPQPGQPPAGQPGQTPNPSSPDGRPNESMQPPVNAAEESAIKGFREEQDLTKRDQLAEDFLQKYPQSRYLPEIYNWQVKFYYGKGDVEKMEAAADKQLSVYPNDPQTLAIVGAALPRAWNASLTQEQKEKRLDKAEKYSQKALDLLPVVPKPEGMADATFSELKNETYAMAYSGLGLVAFRRGKFGDAIPNLEKAVKADPERPDPVNYYVLGKADEQASHFDDAVAAFTKCAAIPSGIKDTCTKGIDEAKKLSATQMSSPK